MHKLEKNFKAWSVTNNSYETYNTLKTGYYALSLIQYIVTLFHMLNKFSEKNFKEDMAGELGIS